MLQSEREMEGGEQVGAMETFLKWATDLGITDSSLSHSQTQSSCLGQSLCISHFPQSGGRGLAAANDLTKNQLVLRVPKSALITIQTLLSNDIKHSLCVQRYPNLSSTQRLCVCLLAEMGKGKGSCWYPYLMQIPRCYETLASFTRFETQALQVDDAIWAAEKAILKAKVEWKEAIVLMKELELRPQFQTFKSWLWASATVSSRTMHVSWDDAGCLCPVGDFFNYAAPGEDMDATETTDDQFNGHVQRLTDAGYEEDADAYCFYARRSYGKGEQVLLSYGMYTNLELLEHYGFLLNDNSNEKLFIQLKSDIISNSYSKDSLYIQQDGKPSFALLSALRLWATPPNRRKSVCHLAYSGLQVSQDNEILVMRYLGNKCSIMLKRLPSSIEEDILLLRFIGEMLDDNPLAQEVEKMLAVACGAQIHDFFVANGLEKGGNCFEFFPLTKKARGSMERWKLAVQWRLSHKQILVCCVSYCTQIIKILSPQQ